MITLIFVLAAVPSIFAQNTVQISGQSVPLHHSEEVPSDESESILAINDVFREFFKRQYTEKNQNARRGVHPKAHGCVNARFIVNADLPLEDQVGIFQPGAKYSALVRFSNAGPRPTDDDSIPDSRGFGLKIYGIPGKTLLPLGEDTQDFTMNSTDAFFSNSAKNYHRFVKIAFLETNTFMDAATNFVFELFKTFQPLLGLRVKTAFEKIRDLQMTNPAGAQYFSMAAQLHGSGPDAPTVKYSVVPCGSVWPTEVNTDGPDYLKKNLKATITTEGACFRFLVQKNPEERLPVEDITQPWSESEAPFHEVAKILIPIQNMVDDQVCERSIINPWNTLPEHRPIGAINRLRLSAYLFSIEARKRH